MDARHTISGVVMLRLLHRATPRRDFSTHFTKCSFLHLKWRAKNPLVRFRLNQRRDFIEIPTVLLPPVVFGGLALALWTWKCLMMVIFQNKIIYMPGLPPNARQETIADYKHQCGGIHWREEAIKSLDNTRISLCVGSVENRSDVSVPVQTVYVLYFQGNASSIPPRLPFLSPVLRILKQRAANANFSVRYIIVCCSYRGYWTSAGRASEKGISKDAAAALKWINLQRESQHGSPSRDEEIPVVIWGQSIGAGVASSLAADRSQFSSGLSLKALILETPFLSVRTMLETLYPQKWLPYRYLWPFLWNHLDSDKALILIRERFGSGAPHILLLEAGKDELVPSSHGKMLEERCLKLRLTVDRRIIGNALHTEVMARQEGLLAVIDIIQAVAEGASNPRKEFPFGS